MVGKLHQILIRLRAWNNIGHISVITPIILALTSPIFPPTQDPEQHNNLVEDINHDNMEPEEVEIVE